MTRTTIFRNLSWLFFDKVIRTVLLLLVGIWIARYLGPSDFGVLSYALAYTALFSVFIRLGLDQILVREIVKKEKLTNYFLGTAFVLKLVGGLLAIIFVALSLVLVSLDPLSKAVILIISAGFVFQSLDVIDYFFQSKILSKYVVVARNSALILTSALKIYFILNGFEVIYFALAQVLDFLLVGIFLTFAYRLRGNAVGEWQFSKKIAWRLLKYSWPLGLSLFLITIHTKVDQIMIGVMLDQTQVGLYSVAVQLSEFWYFIPAIIISTLMPYFVTLRTRNKALYQARLVQLYSLMFWLGTAAGIFVIFFGDQLVTLLFGEAYADAYLALVFNIWNGIWVSQGVARGIWLINENLQIYRLYTNAIIVILNLSLNFILIPLYGIAGAAIATLATQSIGTWVVSAFWRPIRGSTWSMIKSVNPIYLFSIRRI